MKTTHRKNTSTPVGRTFLAFGAALLLCASAQAATDSWTGATNVNWNASNWSGGNNPPQSGDALIFGSSNASGLTLTDNLMTPATFNVAGITFTANAVAFIINPATTGTNGFTLTGSIVNNSTSLKTINDLIAISGTQIITTTAGGGNITLGGTISGGGLTAAGSGDLILGAANTYTGVLTVESGTVTGSNSSAFGSVANVITLGDSNTASVAGGATLVGGAYTFGNAITTAAAAGSNPLAIGNTSGAATLFTGNLTLNNNLVVTANGGSVTLGSSSSTITGSGNIITNSSSNGNVVLGGTYTNATGWTGNVIVNTGTYTNAANQLPGVSNAIGVNSGAEFLYTTAWSNPFAGLINGAAGGGTISLSKSLELGGSGSYLFSGTIVSPASYTFTKLNSGTQTFSGPVALSGAGGGVDIYGGALILSPANSGSFTLGSSNMAVGDPTVTGSTGNATLVIQGGTLGNYTITETTTNNITINGGNALGSGTGQGTLSLEDGSINTLTINTAAAAKTQVLVMGKSATAPAILDMDMGNNMADQILVQSGMEIHVGGTGYVLLNLNGIGGINAGGSAVLINIPGANGNMTVGGFILNSTTGNFSGVTSVTLSQAASTLTVIWGTPTSTPATAYWDGAVSGTWNELTGGTNNNSNWSSTAGSVTNIKQVPGSNTNVLFSVTGGGSNPGTVLGGNIAINSLEFTSAASGASAVTIGGAANILTINASSGTGITVDSGAGNQIISTNVALGGPQTWAINNSGTLNVSGTISGNNNALTVSGNGELILGGNNSFSGGLTINSGTVELNNSGALNSSSPNAVAFGPSSTGVLDLNGNNVMVGSLSTAPVPGTPVIQNANVSTSGTLVVNGPGTSSTYSGVLQDGAGSAALGLTLDSGTLNLTNANTYSGITTVNGGDLNISGSLGSSSIVTVNSGGILSGTGGKIGGAVTVNAGGEIAAGTPSAPGVLTLGSGMTLSGTSISTGTIGGIAAFNVISGGANDEIKITGNLTLNSGAILEVTSGLTVSGTYALITYTGNINPGITGTFTGLDGIKEESLSGQGLSADYQFVVNSGTVDLVITPSSQAIPGITITIPASNARVMEGTTVAVSGSVSNTGTGNALNGTLSSATGLNLTVSNLTPPPITVPSGSSVNYSGTITSTGSNLGNNTFGVTVTDSSASPTSQTASGTLDVVANRVISANTSPNFGIVHIGASVSGTIMLSSPGANNQYTSVTVADSSASDSNGISVTGGNPGGTFNGSFTDTRTVGGAVTTLGTYGGTLTLITTGEGLAGESPNNVSVQYSGTTFSGTAAWVSNTGGSWATNGNWVDTQQSGSIQGAPGLAGPASIGDTATFNDVTGQVGVLIVSLSGANPSLAGIAFNSIKGYTIAPGSGGAITLQGTATPISVATGTDTISAVLTGNGLNKTGPGTLILGGTNTYTGPTTISSGIVQITGSALPATTVLTLGDNNNDSGQLILGNSGTTQSVVLAGLQTAGSGANNSILDGGAGSIATLTLSMASGGTFMYGGVLGGGGTNQNNLSVTVSGSGTQSFSGISTYSGTTTIASGMAMLAVAAGETFTGVTLTGGPIGTGTLYLDVTSGSSGLIAMGGARSIDNVTLLKGNNTVFGGSNALTFNQTAGSFSLDGGDESFTNNDAGGVTLAGPVYLNINSNAAALTILGSGTTTISGSVANNNGFGGTSKGVTLQSTGELILSNGNSTYSGSTTVTAGTLTIAANDTVSGGAVTNGPMGESTLDLNGGTVMAGSNPQTIDSPVIITNNSTIGGGNTLTFKGVIASTNTSTLSIVGGTTIFAATNTYTGSTNINGGNLVDNGYIPGAVNVIAGALSGTGSVAGAVTAIGRKYRPGCEYEW